jgi:hypothetical protein
MCRCATCRGEDGKMGMCRVCHGTGEIVDNNPPIKNNSSSSSCFIATATYGSHMAEEVCVLRQFRDKVLLNTQAGNYLVSIYYRYSPSIANKIRKSAVIRIIVKIVLHPVIFSIRKYLR